MANCDRILRLTTAGGIPYAIVEGYPKLEEDEDDATVIEQYIIEATQINAFFEESFPDPAIVSGFPMMFPRRTMPGRTGLVTRHVKVEPFDGTKPIDPFGADAGVAIGSQTYSAYARVTITYGTGQNNPQDFFERSINIGGEFLPIPSANLEIEKQQSPVTAVVKDPSSGGYDPLKDPTVGAHKVIPTAEWHYKWKYAIAPNWTRYFELLGKVNSKEDPLICENALAETVLFMGVSGSQTFRFYRLIDASAWNLDFTFAQRAVIEGKDTEKKVFGWNHFYVPNPKTGTGEWRRLRRKNSGKHLYDADNLKKLWFPDEALET